MAGRGLDQVLHYLIPEDEQREARARARERVPDPSPGAADGPSTQCWWIGLEPTRALARAAAVELACARAREAEGSGVLATFEPGPLLRLSPDVDWQLRDAAGIRKALAGAPRPALLLARPSELAELAPAGDAARDGLALLVDASPRGVEGARAWLARHAARFEGWRVGAIISGARGASAAVRVAGRIAEDARRRLGLEVEDLGSIERDANSFRSLLHGSSVFELDPGSRTALGLTALARRLTGGASARIG